MLSPEVVVCYTPSQEKKLGTVLILCVQRLITTWEETMLSKSTILVIEDMPEYAAAQLTALHALYPGKQIIHVDNMEDAIDILRDDDLIVEAILTDNGCPLKPGGRILNGQSEEGGAGAMLIRQLRAGEYGRRYQKIRIAWHANEFDNDKVRRIMELDGDLGRTYCFKKPRQPDEYMEICKKLRPPVTVH